MIKSLTAAVVLALLFGSSILITATKTETELQLGAVKAPDSGGATRQDSRTPKVIRSVEQIRARRAGLDANNQPGAKDAEPAEADPFGIGMIQPIPITANAHTASLEEAFTTGIHPERWTAMVKPKPFDKAVFLEDPQTYLNTIEPGRVYETAQPAPGIRELKAVGPNHRRVYQGEFVTLTVNGAPKAPVTFTSFDTGEFDNRLPSITVQSDGRGIASVKFYGTPGTVEDVNILAGSPEAWGQARFLVVVMPPAKNQ